MASKHIRPTNHNRKFSQSTAAESSPELESDEDTDQENFLRDESDEHTDNFDFDLGNNEQDANDFAIYTDDEDSPNFYTNQDEDIGLTVSEGEEDMTPQPHYTPSVINYMPSQSPEDEDPPENEWDLGSTSHQSDGDDSSIEQEEEDLIQDEFGGNDQESSESEEDFYDFFAPQRQRQDTQPTPPGGEDDSYLWEYFFSSDSEDETPGQGNNEEEEDSEGYAQRHAQAQYLSGESTDEEDNLPVPSKRASNNRAVEVLGANSHMRPPVLGSWNIENANGNVGIIDGLTTRTLSPPPQSNEDDYDMGNQSWLSESDGEQAVQLDEFINTDELDFDEDNEEENSYLTTPLVYRSKFNKNVPMSAFRNRSSPHSNQHNFDQSFRRRRRSFGQPNPTNNVIISPVRSLRKRQRQRPRRHHQHQQQHKPEDFGDDMLEFYEMGNMTPLFEI